MDFVLMIGIMAGACIALAAELFVIIILMLICLYYKG